jgi:hypothetical protein
VRSLRLIYSREIQRNRQLETPMNEGRVATYFRNVMKKVSATHPAELIHRAHGLWAAAQQRPYRGQMVCPQTRGRFGPVLQ